MIDLAVGPMMVQDALGVLPTGHVAEVQFNDWQPVDQGSWLVLGPPEIPWRQWRIFTGSSDEITVGPPSILAVLTDFQEWPVAPATLGGRQRECARILDGLRPQLIGVDYIFRQGRFSIVDPQQVTEEEVLSVAEQFILSYSALSQLLGLYHAWIGRYRYWHRRGRV